MGPLLKVAKPSYWNLNMLCLVNTTTSSPVAVVELSHSLWPHGLQHTRFLCRALHCLPEFPPCQESTQITVLSQLVTSLKMAELFERLWFFTFLKYVRACMPPKLLQSCLTLCDPMDGIPPASSVHGILQARILEWVAMPSSKGSAQPRDSTPVCLLHCQANSLPWAPPEKPPFKVSIFLIYRWAPRIFFKPKKPMHPLLPVTRKDNILSSLSEIITAHLRFNMHE